VTVQDLIDALRPLPRGDEVWIQIGEHMDVADRVIIDSAGDPLILPEGS
jgi:hypothetical protein